MTRAIRNHSNHIPGKVSKPPPIADPMCITSVGFHPRTCSYLGCVVIKLEFLSRPRVANDNIEILVLQELNITNLGCVKKLLNLEGNNSRL